MKHLKTIAIVGGGRLSKQFIANIVASDYVIGVDRGAYWMIVNDVIPNIAIGDFDSVSEKELRVIKQKIKHVEEHPKKKDFTDMELAVEYAILLQPKEVIIYGGIGSRLDHTMANIHLLEKLQGVGVIRDGNNEIRIVSDLLVLKKEPSYPYVSLLPITETIEVTLNGFIYDVSHILIRRGETLGVSNEIRREKAMIEIHRGKALVIYSRG